MNKFNCRGETERGCCDQTELSLITEFLAGEVGKTGCDAGGTERGKQRRDRERAEHGLERVRD